ncbi:MAG TPA: secondary thiamine-phosphate synthase enzyme YjbQ [Candidatus Xenobia bacterium]|jgi:secondary thiamine-phosphate synthase enzyme
MLHRLPFETRQRREIVNITSAVHETLRQSTIKDGFMLVTAQHTTCALVINDANSGWEEDMVAYLERLVPDMRFHHLHDGPEHAKSHLLGALLGPSLTIGISDGRLTLGTWQSLFLLELEGPRPREVTVQLFRG